MKLQYVIGLLASSCHVQAKAVFAHFMVSNTPGFTPSDWANNIQWAQDAHIDAFALNMAFDEATTASQLPLAFAAANARGFKLFFSFDYAGNGKWPASSVLALLNTYAPNGAYYRSDGRPLVSTFEGPSSAADWRAIKAGTNYLFYPDWSSLGAKEALLAGGGGIVDGLFSWAAWPWGNTNMDTYTDASYAAFLDQRFGGNGEDFSHYMMPISPWFFTNLPGYGKNWLWRGDSLWIDRWMQAIYLQPKFVQIISWNDFGESHYIAPLDSRGYAPFTIGEAPFNYVLDMPHGGWRLFLPYLIDTYKNNVSTITQEFIVAWYRPNPANGSPCNSGGTSGNTHSQFQFEFSPAAVVQDSVFYAALLTGPGATVTVTIGGVASAGGWQTIPSGGIGIYQGSVPMNGRTGAVTIVLSRGGATINGKAITTACTNGVQNWNAWVGYAWGQGITATPASTTNQVCVAGTGAGNFAGLCSFSCSYGYCPVGACVCTKMGPKNPLPPSKNVNGYPAAGMSASYSGLCAFACNYNYCPSSACGLVQVPLVVPTISPFLPQACTGGSGVGGLAGLCGFGCGYGFCPIIACTCTSRGALGSLPPYTGDDSGKPVAGLDKAVFGDLCKFAVQYGYLPSGVCRKGAATGSVPPIGPSGTIPPVNPTDTRPTNGPTGSNPPIGPSGTIPSVNPTDTRPTNGPTGSNPPIGPSGSNPPIGPSGTIPPVNPTNTRPTNGPPVSNPPIGPSGTIQPTNPTNTRLPMIARTFTDTIPTPTPGASTQSDYAFTGLFHHNKHRSNHSSADLTWSTGLAETAAKVAASCVFSHQMDVDGGGYAQNIAAHKSPVDTAEEANIALQGAIDKWYGEVTKLDAAHLGCASHFCSAGWLTVCNYLERC